MAAQRARRLTLRQRCRYRVRGARPPHGRNRRRRAVTATADTAGVGRSPALGIRGACAGGGLSLGMRGQLASEVGSTLRGLAGAARCSSSAQSKASDVEVQMSVREQRQVCVSPHVAGPLRAPSTPGGVTPRPRLLSRTVSRAAARGRRCAHSRRDVLRSSRWSKVSAPSSGETNRRRARRTHSRRAPVADLARSLPRARPAERRAGGASRKRMPSEQMRLSICSCRESLERSPRSASRRSAPATFASRAVR